MECIDALLRVKVDLETFNIDYVRPGDDSHDDNCTISESGAELIAWFGSRSKWCSNDN